MENGWRSLSLCFLSEFSEVPSWGFLSAILYVSYLLLDYIEYSSVRLLLCYLEIVLKNNV